MSVLKAAWLRLLDSLKLQVSDCAGISVAFPSLIDVKSGRVLAEYGKYADAMGLDLRAWAKTEFNLPLAIDPTAARVLDVAPTSIFQGYDALYRRPAQPFRLLGTSSEFAYDAKTGAQATDVEVYCPVASNGGKVALKAAVVYRRKLGAFEASFDPSSCGW